MSKLLHAVAFGTVIITAGGLGFLSYQTSQPNAPVAASATQPPGFSLPNLNGELVSDKDFAGRWLLVNFWATWCPPCVEEMPLLEKVSNNYQPLAVVGIALDDQQAVSQFIQRVPVSFPLLIAEGGGSQLARQYGNTAGALPFTVLIDPQGAITRQWLGPLKADKIDAELGEYLR